MKEIIVISKVHGEQIIQIDDEDFDLVNRYKWCVFTTSHSHTLYAVSPKTKKKPMILMHRLVSGLNSMVDHIDRNGLNNQKSNLRPCSHKQNSGNQQLLSTNKTGFRGVRLVKSTGRYEAYITRENRFICLGTYSKPEIAAHAYNKAAVDHFGEFAELNEIISWSFTN